MLIPSFCIMRQGEKGFAMYPKRKNKHSAFTKNSTQSSKLNRQQMKSPTRAADTMFEAQQHLLRITVISSIATKANIK
jgi:hypothetical protein